jgi:hypothetical protein
MFARPEEGRLSGLSLAVGGSGPRLQAMQESRGAFGMSGGGEDRPLVVLQHLQP